MNLSEFEELNLRKNKAEIRRLIKDCEKIIGHPINGISCIKQESARAGERALLVNISFKLDDIY